MTKLTISVAILSRANGAARLTAIDTEAKTCTVYNGKEKVIKWSSAAEYKLDTGKEKKPTLTPKLLTALHDAEVVHHVDETAAAPEAAQPVEEAQETTQDATPEESAQVATDTQEVSEKPKRQRTPKGEISDNEKIFLSMIPTHPEFKGVESDMVARTLIKKMQEVHGLPIPNGRTVFQSLKSKGYYSAKGKESGHNLTTFQLSERGVQYLAENNLLPVSGAAAMEA